MGWLYGSGGLLSPGYITAHKDDKNIKCSVIEQLHATHKLGKIIDELSFSLLVFNAGKVGDLCLTVQLDQTILLPSRACGDERAVLLAPF